MIAGIPVRNITVELTQRCHRRCPFCYLPDATEDPPGADAELPARDLAERVRVLMADTGCRRVQLSGGEPLLRRDLLDFIDALGTARISLLTDGAHLDTDLAAALAARGVGPIQPTVLAGTAEGHDALRGPGAFDDVTRAVATAVAAGIRTVVSMVVTSRNWGEAAAVAELAFALGAETLALARYCPTPGRAVELVPTTRELHSAVEAAAPVCRTLGLRLASVITIPRCAWPDPADPPLRSGVCSLVGPSATVTIGPDAGVRTCAMSREVVGTLGETPWLELAQRLWERELAPVRAAVPEICRGCRWLAGCLGGCRLSGAAQGSLDGPDPLAPGL